MNFKKFFTAVSACAVAALSMAALTSTVSAATVVGKAMLYGTMGTYSQITEAEATTNGSTVANIDGNAQYEATWNITGAGASSIDFLALQIMGADPTSDTLMNFTAVQYPDLKITVDEVYVDGIKVETYKTGLNSTNYSYYADNRGMARVYLASTLDTPMKCEDLSTGTVVAQKIKVVFTVSGLSGDGTSNVTSVPAVTTLSTNMPLAETTTTVVQNNVITNSGGFSGNNQTTIPSTTTGDGGVAAVAIAGLAITATAAVLSKVKFGKKKK